MLNALAQAEGVAECLAKFAIDAATLRKMQSVYGHLSSENFNKVIQNRIALDNRGKAPQADFDQLLQRYGHAPAPAPTTQNPTVSHRGPRGNVPTVGPDTGITPGKMPVVTAPSFQNAPPVAPGGPLDKTVVRLKPLNPQNRLPQLSGPR